MIIYYCLGLAIIIYYISSISIENFSEYTYRDPYQFGFEMPSNFQYRPPYSFQNSLIYGNIHEYPSSAYSLYNLWNKGVSMGVKQGVCDKYNQLCYQGAWFNDRNYYYPT